jgi:hypothetical protein
MTCEEVKKDLALGILGLGAPDKQKDIDLHVESCPDCARRRKKAWAARSGLAMKDPVTPPNWVASWRKIETQSVRKRRFPIFSAHRRRWAFVGAGLVAAFILGAFMARVFLSGPKTASSPEIFAGVNSEAAWLGYADRLELLLVDIGNRADIERPKELLKQEKLLVDRILEETRTLKKILAIAGNEDQLSLLNDAEDLLNKIAGDEAGDKEAERNAAKIVRASTLKAKLHLFRLL